MNFEALHSNARILVQLLQDNLVVDQENTDEWASFVSYLPDTDDSPANAVALYDTAGFLDGRSMKSGYVYQHPGFMVHVQSEDYDKGFNKANEILNFFGTVQGELVVIEAATYRINSISITSGVLGLGESDIRNRRKFSFNGTVSITNLIEE